MKKIKTLNKLLSSLTLLSPLLGIGFNNQYQNIQTTVTENSNKLNNYFVAAEQRTMGDITVNVEETIITEFVSASGEGKLVVDSDITEITGKADIIRDKIKSLDFSKATNLTTIGGWVFYSCSKITDDLLVIPHSVTNIGKCAFGGASEGPVYNNICFLSDNPPQFGEEDAGRKWFFQNPNIYVPTDEAKQKYLSQQNFGVESGSVFTWAFNGPKELKQASGIAGSRQYTNWDKFTVNNIQIVMTEGEKPEWLSIDSQGLLSWTDQCVAGTYKFKLQGTITNLNYTFTGSEITFTIYDIDVTGKRSILSKKTNGQEQYSFSSTPEGLTIDQWDIVMTEGDKPDWLSINSSGLLSWTNECVAGTYKFRIKIYNSTYELVSYTDDVTLTIYSDQATINGEQEISIEQSKKSSWQYEFISNPLGLDADQWEIVMTEGQKPEWLSISEQGLLSCTNNSIEGVYNFKITADNLEFSSHGEVDVILTITPQKSKNWLQLILGLSIGIGIPVILAIAFIIWFATKKKKTTVKI